MSTLQPPDCRLDHLVIAASHCAQGADWFEVLSGVRLPAGGRHPLMGTHNHLTALSADSFLEIIAIDPEAPEPVFAQGHARWFALDEATRRKRLAVAPRLTTWVVATDDLEAALGVARGCGVDPGEPVALMRDDLHWQLALRTDGSLACDGVFPILIQWPEGVNPVARMQDQGVRLDSLSLTHPEPERISVALQALGIEPLADVRAGATALRARMHVGERHFMLES